MGYFYERKKNQYLGENKNVRLDSELMAQIYLAYYLDMPAEAKNKKSIIFGDKYDDIFNEEEVTAIRMFHPYRVYLPIYEMKQEIQSKKRNKEQVEEAEAFISRAVFHVLNAVKYIAEKKKIGLDKDRDIQKAVREAINVIKGVVKKEMKERNENYTHDIFFKEPDTAKKIFNKINGIKKGRR